ncbi:MAG: oxygen-dependent coproporphyrinogen oxidase [Planctomycetes bacterium]|nr:oxygen-dependent coproporphyrinogen oxidase [Planctomycetota bacterium]
MSAPMKDRAAALFREVQELLCSQLETLDGKARFGRDAWDRPAGGGGLTRVLADGAVIEKGAINFSEVGGAAPPALKEHLEVESDTFFATGTSMIFHPQNPHAPTMHANVRYFEAGSTWWFGGGLDMTPYYLYEEDAHAFHRAIKDVCARHPVADYPAWKAWCDRYFHLSHRGEARGIGGIFFDHVSGDPEALYAFVGDLGRNLLTAYLEILAKRKDTPFTPEQERWQLQRRGRYVEFNLIHDRGTKFGLQTGGRTESIFVSLPARVRWDYMAEPAAGTPEHELLSLVRGEPRDW